MKSFNAKNRLKTAPIGYHDEKPITKGKGRFGPFIKWNDLFINIPRAYNFDTLTQKDCNELIEKKIEKEANRFIKQWPEEKIAIENGRWGPFSLWQEGAEVTFEWCLRKIYTRRIGNN